MCILFNLLIICPYMWKPFTPFPSSPEFLNYFYYVLQHNFFFYAGGGLGGGDNRRAKVAFPDVVIYIKFWM